MATTGAKIKSCEICGVANAKYTCPKCEVRSCCLRCVNIHKEELNCNGIRDLTKFVSLATFTDMDLLSDYCFLEQVNKSIDIKRRNPKNKYTRQSILPVHLHKLRNAAAYRKVSLLFMPQIFSRHKENTTFLNWKTNELFWRIEWIFPQAENTKWIVKKALDNITLATLLEQVLNPVSLEGETNIEELNIRSILASRLQFYRAAGLSGIKVLLKAEKIKKASFRFYELDLTLTLKENLENKTIVEFPTLHVIMKDHSHMYEIVDTDEETSDTEGKNYGAKKKKINSDGHNTIKKENGTVNYFFNDFSEYDDERIDNKLQEKKCASDLNIPYYEDLIKM